MTEQELEAEVHRFLARPYRKVISGDPVGGFLAEAPEFPGCFTCGETIEEAAFMLQDAMEGWLYFALRDGDTIPEPAAALAVA